MERRRVIGSVIWIFCVLCLLRAGKLWAEEKPNPTYVGHEQCQLCHPDQLGKFAETRMGKLFLRSPRNDLERWACENCHGPGSAHVQNPVDPTTILRFGKHSPAPVGEQNQACLQCHERGAQTHWLGSAHETQGLACTACHTVMGPTGDHSQLVSEDEKTPFYAKRADSTVCLQCHLQQRAQMLRSSHMPLWEGKMTCTDCHNPHGTVTPALLIENSINENCYKCHADKRGPFLWEHPPVLENCLNCHDAHGSVNEDLLTVKVPRLCQQCHIEIRHPSQPFSATSRFVFNRACTNCHPQVHGSNHPSGVMLQR